MTKGIIFDIDGVILDSMEVWDHAGEWYLERKKILPEENLGEKMFSMTMAEGARYLKKRYEIKDSPEQIIDEINETVAEYYRNHVQLKPGVGDFLRNINKNPQRHNVKITAATTSDREIIEAAFRRLNISAYFERIFTCTEHDTDKHHPDIFYLAAEFMGCKPEETLVFEDALYSINTARKAGFKCVGVYDQTSKNDWKEIQKQAEYHIDGFRNYEQIMNWL